MTGNETFFKYYKLGLITFHCMQIKQAKAIQIKLIRKIKI